MMHLKLSNFIPERPQPAPPCHGPRAFAVLLGAGGLLLASLFSYQGRAATETSTLLDAWLAAQTNVHSWSAEFTQTRSLKALTQPLVTTGQVWFSEPNRFRWELGQPPQTIAVREPERMLVIYPRLKVVEQYLLNGGQSGPWRDALSLFEAGFPRKRSDIEDRFRILDLSDLNGVLQLVLQPKSAAARRMMPKIEIHFGRDDLTLRATELHFADGSVMRNDFKNTKLNPAIEPKLFHPDLPPDYKVTQPLGK
jgi:outer membrane lipoprotein-sorting protein